jgi:putative transposase
MVGRCRAFQFWLSPTVKQQRALTALLTEERRLYNAALEERRGAWRLEGRTVTRFDQYRTLTGLAEQEPALMAFGVTVARGTLSRLDRAYKAFFRRVASGETPGFPRFRSAARFDSAEWPDTTSWKLDETGARLYLQGVGHIRIRMHRPTRGTPKTLTVARVGRRWRVTVFCADVPAEPLLPTGKAIGVDVGVTVAAALSDGQVVDNPRHLAASADALARAQRVLTGRQRGSRRRAIAAQEVGRLHRRIAKQRRDFQHKLSRALVNENDVIVIEDLQIPNMTRRPKPVPDVAGGFCANGAAAKAGLNKSILDVGWGRLRQMLTYKAEEAGRELIAVNPRHTSQTCAHCGHTDRDNRHGAVFECVACGHWGHADVNAAVNILRAGLAQRHKREAKREVASTTRDQSRRDPRN